MLSYRPLEQMVMHRCPVSGATLVEVVTAGAVPRCTPPGESCGAVVLPDQAPRAGHAWVFCPYCQASIGLCGAASLLELAGETASVLEQG